ncbi:Protein phosphatase PP2A regulatory subunit B [Asimina triloba]
MGSPKVSSKAALPVEPNNSCSHGPWALRRDLKTGPSTMPMVCYLLPKKLALVKIAARLLSLRLCKSSSFFSTALLNENNTRWETASIPSLSPRSGTNNGITMHTAVYSCGKLVQIEHALMAVGSGQTSLGIKAANGVVIATEKKLPSILVDEASVQKIQLMTPNIGVVYSGMGPDSRVLVRKSRKQAQQYFRLYKRCMTLSSVGVGLTPVFSLVTPKVLWKEKQKTAYGSFLCYWTRLTVAREPIPVTQLVRETAAVMQEFTQSGGVRPFGVSLLVAGYDDNGPQLYQVDPSGSYFSWKASAMGKNVSNAKTFLEKRYTDDMELDDAVHTAILTLKEGFEGQISGKNIEIGIIGADRKFRQVLFGTWKRSKNFGISCLLFPNGIAQRSTIRVLTPAEIDDYLGEVE